MEDDKGRVTCKKVTWQDIYTKLVWAKPIIVHVIIVNILHLISIMPGAQHTYIIILV